VKIEVVTLRRAGLVEIYVFQNPPVEIRLVATFYRSSSSLFWWTKDRRDVEAVLDHLSRKSRHPLRAEMLRVALEDM